MMKPYKKSLFVVANAARARFFTHAGTIDAELAESIDLVSPSHKATAGEPYSESRPGTKRTGAGGHAVDDHRLSHRDDVETGFAKEIAAAIGTVCDDGLPRLVVYSPPSLLGKVRTALQRESRFDPSYTELVDDSLDLTKLSVPEIHDRLTGAGLLPARRQPLPNPRA